LVVCVFGVDGLRVFPVPPGGVLLALMAATIGELDLDR
jgi:hypothetical protein